MSDLTKNQNERIKKAYEGYSNHISLEETKVKYDNLVEEINIFKEKLRIWKSSDSIDFIVDFALSKEASVFAADGMGKIFTQGFKQFMSMVEVREKLEKMIYFKFNENDNINKHNSIASYDIKDFLDKNKFSFDRPLLLTGRLLLMIFTELYTTIADEIVLNQVCERLEIKTNARYLAKHRQIRMMVETYLKENNLYDKMSDMGRASIAWWVGID